MFQPLLILLCRSGRFRAAWIPDQVTNDRTLSSSPTAAKVRRAGLRAAEAEMALSRRIEAGWFGDPGPWGWRALVLTLGIFVLLNVERAFIKPTRRKGEIPRV